MSIYSEKTFQKIESDTFSKSGIRILPKLLLKFGNNEFTGLIKQFRFYPNYFVGSADVIEKSYEKYLGKCDNSCLSCSGIKSNRCLSCPINFFLQENEYGNQIGTCVSDCFTNYTKNSITIFSNSIGQIKFIIGLKYFTGNSLNYIYFSKTQFSSVSFPLNYKCFFIFN